jgi:hypothetical protein
MIARETRAARLRRTRDIGLARVYLGPLLTAVGLNALQLSEWWLKTARANTRITPFAWLMVDAAVASPDETSPSVSKATMTEFP